MYKQLLNQGIPLVTNLIWSPTGEMVAAIGQDGGVIFYNQELARTQILNGFIEHGRALDWSPNGNLIVCSDTMNIDRRDQANAKQRVRVWEFNSGDEQQVLYEHSNHFAAVVCWSSDSRKIAASISDARILVWDVDNFQLTNQLVGHTDYASSLFWGPDNKILISVAYDNTIKVWDWAMGRLIKTIDGLFSSPAVVDYHRRSNSVVVPDTTGQVKIWKILSKSPGIVLHNASASSGYQFRWSKDGKYILGRLSKSVIGVWDASTGSLKYQIQLENPDISSLQWYPDSHTIIVSAEASLIRYQLDDLDVIKHVHKVDTSYRSLEWSPNGNMLAGISKVGYPQFWQESITGEFQAKLKVPERNLGGLYTSALDYANQQVAIGYETGNLRIWNLNTNQLKIINATLSSPIQRMLWVTPKSLVVGTLDASIAIVNIVGESVENTLSLEGILDTLGLSEDGETILCTTQNPNKAFKISTKTLEDVDVYETMFMSAWNPTGTLLARISDTLNNRFEIVDVSGFTNTVFVDLDVSKGQVSHIKWSHDANYTVIGTTEGWLYVIDIKDKSIISVVQSHELGVNTIKWCPNKPIFASGGDDHKVVIWNIQSKNSLQAIFHTSPVTTLNWSEDGRKLLVFGLDGTSVMLGETDQV